MLGLIWCFRAIFRALWFRTWFFTALSNISEIGRAEANPSIRPCQTGNCLIDCFYCSCCREYLKFLESEPEWSYPTCLPKIFNRSSGARCFCWRTESASSSASYTLAASLTSSFRVLRFLCSTPGLTRALFLQADPPAFWVFLWASWPPAEVVSVGLVTRNP